MTPRTPRLPQAPVKTVLVSGGYPSLARALACLGINCIKTEADPRLPEPVRCHPDMQLCGVGPEWYVLKGSPLKRRLADAGIKVLETAAEPKAIYPYDVLCNGFTLGARLIGNLSGLDAHILAAAQRLGYGLLPVRQGYASCAVALVNEKAAITADEGMARQLEGLGLEVLRIRPGGISLPGYDTGFIGGCCGKLGPDKLAFFGELGSHPDGQRIQSFVAGHGVIPCELATGTLVDVGGIIPLQQEL